MNFQLKRRVDFWLGGLLLLLLFPMVRAAAMLLRRNHSLEQRRGCAVIKLVGAGSLFLAMPAMQAIRREFPTGRFFLVGTRGVVEFARAHDWFDECWLIDDSSLSRLIVSGTRAIWQVMRHTDHLIDLEVHSRLTTVFGLLTMVRNRLGFVDEIVFWRRGFYTHTTWFNTNGPSFVFYDLLARWFGVEQLEVSRFHGQFRQQISRATLPADLRLPAGYVAIGHACSDFGKERQLRPQEWARVLRPLTLSGFQFVFLGGRQDSALADEIITALGSGRNLCGRLSISQSARVIAGAKAFYGIDSLLLHLARALGVHSTSFWGPTDPATRLRPIGTPERIVFARQACAPCIHVAESPPCHGRRDCIAAAVRDLTTVGGCAQAPSAARANGWQLNDTAHAEPVSISYA